MNYNDMTKEELIELISNNEAVTGKYGLVWDREREPEKVVVDCDKNIPEEVNSLDELEYDSPFTKTKRNEINSLNIFLFILLFFPFFLFKLFHSKYIY